MNLENATKEELQTLEQKLAEKYQKYKDAALNLDLTRGNQELHNWSLLMKWKACSKTN